MKKQAEENQGNEKTAEEVITEEEITEPVKEEPEPTVVLGKAKYYEELFRGGK